MGEAKSYAERRSKFPEIGPFETPALWRESGSCWEGERWLNICRMLGVNPRTEAMWANFGLRRPRERRKERPRR